MNIWNLFKIAYKALMRNKMHTLLVVFGTFKKGLERAINKFRNFSSKTCDYTKIFSNFAPRNKDEERQYKSYFLIPKRDRLVPLPASDIAYICTDEKITKVITKENKAHYFSQNLDGLMQQLDSRKFFRTNRRYIVSHNIKRITLWFGNKISLNLTVSTP